MPDRRELQLAEEAEATIGQVHAALVGRTIVDVHDRYGSPSIVLDNGQAFDVEPSVVCGGYCHGGTTNIDYALRKAFDDEVPSDD